MRKNCFSLLGFVLIVLLFVSACVKEETETIDQGVPAPTIYASQENTPDTRSSITVNSEGVGKILWSPADEISVFYGASTGVLYTSTNTEPAAEAAFTTTAIIGSNEGASSNIWGLYPYNSSAVCGGSSVTTTLPATQYGVPGTFDDDLFVTIAHSTSTNLHFFNVCGGIKFSLSRDDISSITFAGNNDEDLAGDISVSFVDDLPNVSVINGQKTITLTPKDGETFAKDTYYYLVVLPQTLSDGFTMTFETDTQLGTFNYTDNAITLKRSVFSKKDEIDTYAEFVDKDYPQPANVIYYTSSDGEIITPCATDNWVIVDQGGDLTPYIFSAFNANILKNEYTNGRGKITFDRDLSVITGGAFQHEHLLTSISIPDQVTTIDGCAFWWCENLQSIKLPSNLLTLDAAFHYGLNTITLPYGLTSIGEESFYGCYFSAIDIPNSVTEIGPLAFENCQNLVTVNIPESVTSIGKSVFKGCISLQHFSGKYATQDGLFLINNGTLISYALGAPNETVTLPEGITEINGYAFWRGSNLTRITIPESVTYIGDRAFCLCSNLTSITILAYNPPVVSTSVFDSTNNCPIYVPASSVETYKNAQGWSSYANRIQAIPAPIPTPEAVDLGLTVKWASFNLGASSPEEYGDYYAWGETETKTNFSWATYKWCNGTETSLTKYNTLSDYGSVDNKVTLDMEDDAAHVNLGGDWRMPTHSEIDDLIKNCSAVWTTENGIEGYRFTSKKAGYTNKSIFFPAAGGFWNASVNQVGNRGIYRSSSLNVINGNEPTSAICFCYYPDDIYWNGFARWVGFPIRPVCP